MSDKLRIRLTRLTVSLDRINAFITHITNEDDISAVKARVDLLNEVWYDYNELYLDI